MLTKESTAQLLPLLNRAISLPEIYSDKSNEIILSEWLKRNFGTAPDYALENFDPANPVFHVVLKIHQIPIGEARNLDFAYARDAAATMGLGNVFMLYAMRYIGGSAAPLPATRPTAIALPPPPTIATPAILPEAHVSAKPLMDFLRGITRPVPSGDNSANPKADLANWCGQVGVIAPTYTATREGPDHKPYYAVTATMLDYVVGTGVGTRKTSAEVDAAIKAMKNLTMYIAALRMEDEKFFREDTICKLECDWARTILLNNFQCAAADEITEVISQHINCNANALFNTSGGLILLGLDNDRRITGISLTREDIDVILLMVKALMDEWEPKIDKEARAQFQWKIFPVFTAEEINNGTMFSVMDKIFTSRDPRGMVWPDDRKIVVGLSLPRAETSEKYTINAIDSYIKSDIPRVAFVHATSGGIRILKKS